MNGYDWTWCNEHSRRKNLLSRLKVNLCPSEVEKSRYRSFTQDLCGCERGGGGSVDDASDARLIKVSRAANLFENTKSFSLSVLRITRRARAKAARGIDSYALFGHAGVRTHVHARSRHLHT